ncbi:MAG: hypothetical protein OEW93_10550 [Candidatus Bathyarchaeota archaeon]|nr:hypothetical protein [Candidatus Bathyarchaeota archaeon]
MSDKAFDASRYLSKLNGKDYLEVKWRLLWLRTEHPDATVQTELVKHEAGLALFRAQVTLPAGGRATGWGSETASDFVDYIEKAETKALGRALAALGYGTQFCEDFDFRRDDQGPVVDAPVEPPPAARQARGAARERQLPRATSAQVKAIYSIGRGSKALGEHGVEERARKAYGCLPAELSKQQASELIDALQGELRAQFAARG